MTLLRVWPMKIKMKMAVHGKNTKKIIKQKEKKTQEEEEENRGGKIYRTTYPIHVYIYTVYLI